MSIRSTSSDPVLRGLNAAIDPYWSGPPPTVNAQGQVSYGDEDQGLGYMIGLKQRARDRQQIAYDQERANAKDANDMYWLSFNHRMDNAGDPQGFDAFFEALNEKAPGGIATPNKKGDPMPGLGGLAAVATPYKSNPIDTMLNQQVEAQLAKEAVPGYWNTGTDALNALSDVANKKSKAAGLPESK